jgi:hypothetical protein
MANITWYKIAKEVNALRKNTLRVDLHVHCGEPSEFGNENEMMSKIKGVVSSAIVKGLDIIGIISHEGPFIGQKAMQQCMQEGVDLFVLSGQEYLTTDKVNFIVYNLKDKMPDNLLYEQAVKHAHDNKGFVMIIDAGKRMLQHINQAKGTPTAPDAVEIYNATSGGYRDIDTEYPTFISSAAKNSRDMDTLNIYTLIDRKALETMGLLPQHYGENYVPQYLSKGDNGQILPQETPQPTIPQQAEQEVM